MDKDVAARVDLMLSAVDAAEKHAKVDKAPSTLKVFMAPEFFFRGVKGAYFMDTVHEVREKLTAGVTDEKYNDWLFIFGSVLASSYKVDKGTYNRTAGSKDEAYNICYAQPGGKNTGDTRVVMKEFKSGIDFVKGFRFNVSNTKYMNQPDNNYTGKIIDEMVEHLAATKASGTGLEQQQGKYGADSGNSIFQYGGITFGVEICLDHLMRRLRKSPPAKDQQLVQIQLVPSAGMNIRNASVVAIKDGYVFNCDGATPHSKVVKVTTAHTGSADATHSDVAELEKADVLKKPDFNMFWIAPQQPELHVYPAGAVPLPKTAP